MEVPTLHTATPCSIACTLVRHVPEETTSTKRANFDELNESMLHSSEEFFAFNPGNFFVEEN